jgi:hypothetical protein
MYSGTTLTPLSGRLLGAHQKIDRLARASLRPYLADKTQFPSTRAILHFEGVNGPDGIKRKSPAKDEPWHYFSPFDEGDIQLTSLITGHYTNLVDALRRQDTVRAAFEAAWIAHAVVDGLTPAHHYPYEEKLTELRGGEGIETRTTLKEKLVMHGDNHREVLRNNWKMWGPRGLITTHGFFEFGVAALLAPVSHKRLALKAEDLLAVQQEGVVELFKRKAREVAGLNMFEQYYSLGWTPALARQVRTSLIPAIVQTVALTWYAAAAEAGVLERLPS